ncbi:MAG: 2-oxoglutarate dehydrogenase complex dihydrolipoyllysine-residue succinyltransferase [Alphaproteobacteria bacterium]
MTAEITVPALGESITEATVARWLKSVGDAVDVDEPVVELETDKVTVEVNAPAVGTLGEILVGEGANVEVGAVLGVIAGGGAAAAKEKQPKPTPPGPEAAAGQAVRPSAPQAPQPPAPQAARPAASRSEAPLSSAVRKLVEENRLDPVAIPATGKGGRLTKGDVLSFLERSGARIQAVPPEPEPAPAPPAPEPAPAPPAPEPAPRGEERVRMTRLRKRIAERLKEAQNTAAMLTTFNEVDMTNVIAVRNDYREHFEKKHGVRLGFMSFFVKACIVALKEIPEVNAEIDGEMIVYKNHYDIGVAVATDHGLVVPVVRDADLLSFAEVEKAIAELGRKARDGRLAMEDLSGGTFTISNGGVYGSLLSTPILNPPQSGILGMHKIESRPVAAGDKVEIRPMMYLALSYDHRIVDGREAVMFLVRLKACIEDPERILLDM